MTLLNILLAALLFAAVAGLTAALKVGSDG